MAHKLTRLVLTDLGENCYILADDDSQAVVIDPGGDADRILRHTTGSGMTVGLILLTHGHADHICATKALKQATGARVGIHAADAPMMESALMCGAEWLGMAFEPVKPDFLLDPPTPVTFGGITLEPVHTPGHSPGSCILVDRANGVVFSGDLVFRGAVGRWDLPFGDMNALRRSLREGFMTLPPEYIVYPGHGEATTVGDELATNPFLLHDGAWQ